MPSSDALRWIMQYFGMQVLRGTIAYLYVACRAYDNVCVNALAAEMHMKRYHGVP